MAVSFFPPSVLHYNNSEFKRNTNCRVKALNLLFPSNGTETIPSLSPPRRYAQVLTLNFLLIAMDVCRQTITAKVSHQNWCKVSQQKSWSYVVRQSPQKFHTRTGAKYRSKSHVCVSSDNHRKSFTPELVQSFAAKVMVVCRQTITVKVSHQNWCKVSQQKSWSYVVSHGRLSFRANADNNSFF